MNFLNQDGQGIIQMMFTVVFAFIMLYVWLQIYVPLYDDYIDPILDNVAYGAVLRIVVQFLPLIVGVSILAIPIMYFSGGRQTYPPQ